jgi:hypothetical protein
VVKTPVSNIFIYRSFFPLPKEGDIMTKNLYDESCRKEVFGAYFCKKPAEDCLYQNREQTMGAPMFDAEKGCVTVDLPQCMFTSLVAVEHEKQQLREKQRR